MFITRAYSCIRFDTTKYSSFMIAMLLHIVLSTAQYLLYSIYAEKSIGNFTDNSRCFLLNVMRRRNFRLSRYITMGIMQKSHRRQVGCDGFLWKRHAMPLRLRICFGYVKRLAEGTAVFLYGVQVADVVCVIVRFRYFYIYFFAVRNKCKIICSR